MKKKIGKKGTGSDLIAKLQRAQTLHDDVSVTLDEIHWMLVEGGGAGAGVPRRGSRPPQFARSLQLSFVADGTASVTIDGSLPFSLPPVLAALLQTLAGDIGEASLSEDSLVPFKTYGEIISSMAQILGGAVFTEGALKQGIHRLRKILAFQGFAGLIQTNRRSRAYRFAVQRKASSAAAALQRVLDHTENLKSRLNGEGG
jgi:hypothetical protein